MTILTITIDTDAINVDEAVDTSVVHVLRRLANRIEEDGLDDRTLYDSNGNPIGKAAVTETDLQILNIVL